MSLATISVDFYDDTDRQVIKKLAVDHEAGGLEVTQLTPEQLDELPDSEFGLVMLTKRGSVIRKFPLNDSGNTWLSSQYFSHTHQKLAFPARFIAAKFIKQACDAYGVTPTGQVAAYAERADGTVATNNMFVEGYEKRWMLEKMAEREFSLQGADVAAIDAYADSPDEHFALVMTHPDGTIVRKYAMPDANHVKVAAAYFDRYAESFPPEHRRNFATAVARRADELGVDVTDSGLLTKWASEELNPWIGDHLEQRKALLPRNEAAHDALCKLAELLSDSSPDDVAKALSKFDEATGISRHYDHALADPYASSVGKVASAWSADVDGRIITEKDLTDDGVQKKLAGYLGSSFAKQMQDDPVAVFESLPAPEKQLVKQVISGEA